VRGSHRIIFQAEPTCWAEFGASRAVFQSHGCSRHVLAGWGSVAGTHSRNYRCGRFLCGGAFAGFAADLVHLVERMEELRLENARSRTARHRMCYYEAGERKLSDLPGDTRAAAESGLGGTRLPRGALRVHGARRRITTRAALDRSPLLRQPYGVPRLVRVRLDAARALRQLGAAANAAAPVRLTRRRARIYPLQRRD